MEAQKKGRGTLYSAERVGDNSNRGFDEFISQLLERKLYGDEKEKSVLVEVNNHNTNKLSAQQNVLLEKIVDRYAYESCAICKTPIPLNEALNIKENGGLCSFHRHQQAS